MMSNNPADAANQRARAAFKAYSEARIAQAPSSVISALHQAYAAAEACVDAFLAAAQAAQAAQAADAGTGTAS